MIPVVMPMVIPILIWGIHIAGSQNRVFAKMRTMFFIVTLFQNLKF